MPMSRHQCGASRSSASMSRYVLRCCSFTMRQANSCGTVKSWRENLLKYLGSTPLARQNAARITFRGDLQVSIFHDLTTDRRGRNQTCAELQGVETEPDSS